MGVTVYEVNFQPGLPGSIATGIPATVRGKLNASGQTIAYGRALVQGSAVNAAILPSTTTKDFIGVCLRTYVYENAQTPQGDFGYADKQMFDVLTQGDIWVEVEEAVAPGDPVFFRHEASGSNTIVGKFRKSADTNTATQITAARWTTKTTGAGIATLQINLP